MKKFLKLLATYILLFLVALFLSQYLYQFGSYWLHKLYVLASNPNNTSGNFIEIFFFVSNYLLGFLLPVFLIHLGRLIIKPFNYTSKPKNFFHLRKLAVTFLIYLAGVVCLILFLKFGEWLGFYTPIYGGLTSWE